MKKKNLALFFILVFSNSPIIPNSLGKTQKATYFVDFKAIIQSEPGNFAANEGIIVAYNNSFWGLGLSYEKKLRTNLSIGLGSTIFFYEQLFFVIEAKTLIHGYLFSNDVFWGAQLGYSPLNYFEHLNIGLLAGINVPISNKTKSRGIIGFGLNGGEIGGLYISAGFGFGIN